MKTKQLTLDAMLCALCAALGYLAAELPNIKFTIESLPILVGGLLFGPVDGMLIGGMGTLIYQLLRYGVSATTLLWIVPYVVCGLVAGGWARVRQFRLSRWETLLLCLAAELSITLLNTIPIYVDSKIYGYYFPGIILGALALRLALCLGQGVAFGLLLPGLTEGIRRAFRGALPQRRDER